MIPEQHIVAWRRHAPWETNTQVEQDLIISRAIVEIFSIPEIRQRLAFRGGTALYKLHITPPARYSEDIDLVQINPESIGDTLTLLRNRLDPWLGPPQRKLKEGRINLVYRVDSEDSPPRRLRLKIEINSREHFSELGLISIPFQVDNPWFRGRTEVTTYKIEELLGTKLRALYQRKKGRDLFDLWVAMSRIEVDNKQVLDCFNRYMSEDGNIVTRALFEANLSDKAARADFRKDMDALLSPGSEWDFDTAMKQILHDFADRLPGEPWKGRSR